MAWIVVRDKRPAHLVEGLTDFVACLVEGLPRLIERLMGLMTARGSEPPRRVAVMRETCALVPCLGSPVGRMGTCRCDRMIQNTSITKTIRKKRRFIGVQSRSG